MATCPNCGEELRVAVVAWLLNPATAPLVSPRCARAWWPAELEPGNRGLWDGELQSFQGKPIDLALLRQGVEIDLDRLRALRDAFIAAIGGPPYTPTKIRAALRRLRDELKDRIGDI